MEREEKGGTLSPGLHQYLEAKLRNDKYMNYSVTLIDHKLFKRQDSVFPISAGPRRI